MTPTPHTLVDEEPDGWLPPGWMVKSKIRHNKRRDKFYFSPSGERFNSKVWVCRHLGIDPKTIGDSPKPNTPRVQSSSSVVCSNVSTEVSTLKTPKKTISPKLKHVGQPQSTPEQSPVQRNDGDYLPGKVYFERVPADGLPPGWIKENKIQNIRGKIRRDAFFTDPVHGYVFRSLKDTLRYIETGEPGRLAIIPKSPVVAETIKVTGNKRKLQLVDSPAQKSNKSSAEGKDSTPASNNSTIRKSGKKDQVSTRSTKLEKVHNLPRRSSGRLTALKEKQPEVQISEQSTTKTDIAAEAPKTLFSETGSSKGPSNGNKRGYKSPLVMSYEESWLDPCIDFAVKTLTETAATGKDLSVNDYYIGQSHGDGSATPGPPGFNSSHISRGEFSSGSANGQKTVGSGSRCNWVRGTDRSLFR